MSKARAASQLYSNRRLAEGYPELDRLALNWFGPHLATGDDANRLRLERLLVYLGRLMPLAEGARVLVLGCGPRPQTVRFLVSKKFAVLGVEPVRSFVVSAREYVGDPAVIVEGSAESIPVPDASQDFVFCESILEHVDSPTRSLVEIHRVLAPGGGAYISTTNRCLLQLSGQNGEFNVPFFHWFPDVVKESFVFHHLHYRPDLANYSERPAVHWFSYAQLCKLGREAGFATFYSLIDLVESGDDAVRSSLLRRVLLGHLKYNPWLRALALLQVGGSIIMLKRRA